MKTNISISYCHIFFTNLSLFIEQVDQCTKVTLYINLEVIKHEINDNVICYDEKMYTKFNMSSKKEKI